MMVLTALLVGLSSTQILILAWAVIVVARLVLRPISAIPVLWVSTSRVVILICAGTA